jgi:hypothetical protein
MLAYHAQGPGFDPNTTKQNKTLSKDTKKKNVFDKILNALMIKTLSKVRMG